MTPDRPRSHLVPRTREGRIATIAFVTIFLLAMPPITHAVLDRPDLSIGGVPFFFVALLAVYVLGIGVLVWALRRGV